jgi:hypothetical protein
VWWLVVLASPIGCRKTSSPREQPSSVAHDAATVGTIEAEVPAAALAPVDFGAPGPVEIAPSLPADRPALDDAGWAADSSVFVLCDTQVGPGVYACGFRGARIPPGPHDDWDPSTAHADPKLTAQVKAMVAKLALTRSAGSWRFARDLQLTWDAPNGGTVRVGARVRGEKPSWAITLRSDNRDAPSGAATPVLLAVSPDGTKLGAIGHMTTGEFSDRMPTAVVETARVAAMAYDDAGFAHHQKKEWAVARALFEKAAAADPTFALPAFNLACAAARMGDAALGDTALRVAILRDPAFKERARTDEDLESLRSAPWFAPLTR